MTVRATVRLSRAARLLTHAASFRPPAGRRGALSVERRGELAPVLARERVVDPELVEDADHDAAQVVRGAVGGWERGEQCVEGRLAVAAVKRDEGLAQVGLARLLEPDARGQALGGEVARGGAEDLERLVVGAGRLELDGAAQRRLVAGLHEPFGLGGHERIQEGLDALRRLDPDELGDDASVLERLDGRDSLNAEGGGEARVGVGVELGQDDLAVAGVHAALEQRCELAAGSAPLGPEVDDDGDVLGPLDDLRLEALLGDVDDHASRVGRRWASGRSNTTASRSPSSRRATGRSWYCCTD